MSKGKKVALAVVAVLVLAGIGSALGGKGKTPVGAPSPSPTVQGASASDAHARTACEDLELLAPEMAHETIAPAEALARLRADEVLADAPGNRPLVRAFAVVVKDLASSASGAKTNADGVYLGTLCMGILSSS